MTLSSVLSAFDDPLVWAAAAAALGWLGARFWRNRNSRLYFIAQLLVFTLLTSLMLAGGVVPYRAGSATGIAARRLLAGALEIAWWLTGAWLAAGFTRAFVVLGRPRQSKLVQDLLAALIYLAALIAIVGYVFDLPVKGLVATSGVAAVVIGLALQSSLADVFSGIVLDIERPYQVGDWVILDDTVQGKVIETNWRATHFLTGAHDVAIIPNSIIAKSRLVNCSTPSRIHGASIRVKLEPTHAPEAGRRLLTEVLLGSAHILRTPAPSVTIKDISAEMVDFELSYSVADVDDVGTAQNELFDQIHRALTAAGGRFAARLAPPPGMSLADERSRTAGPEQLLAAVSLFASLSDDEIKALAGGMKRRMYKAGQVIVEPGTVAQALSIVAYGFLAVSVEKDDHRMEAMRLAPGDYFGELGLLAGEALNGEITALTRVVLYDIPKAALAPLLKARPSMAEELSESLTRRRMARLSVLDQIQPAESHPEGLAQKVTANIRRLFSLLPPAPAPSPAASGTARASPQPLKDG